MADNFATDTTGDGIPSIDNITYDSHVVGPLTIELATNTTGDGIPNFDTATCDPYVGGPFTVNLATNNTKDDLHDICCTTCDSYLEEPASQGFQKWKEGWDEKMLLVRWKREGKGWDDITRAFWRMGKRKAPSGWKSTLKRVEVEVGLTFLDR